MCKHGGYGGMCALHKIAWILVIVGALNWGVIAAFGDSWNLVYRLLGAWPMAERLVYGLVGLSALFMLGQGKCCGQCDGDCEHHGEHKAMPSSGAGMGMPPKV